MIIKRILVTGGAGFIGSALVEKLLQKKQNHVFNIDKLSYAGSLKRLNQLKDNKRHYHYKFDLSDKLQTLNCFKEIDPDLVIHLAAESHVDKSLIDPSNFIQSNIVGTFNLLEASRKHFENLTNKRKQIFRFHHVSTDEVFGSLKEFGQFNECSNYDPRSPYSASKAASDHLVNSWFYSFSLPIVISNCSNNYGPYQYPEKIIPLAISNGIQGKNIPLYGDGMNIRDWLYVDDHVDALMLVAERGEIGQRYCIGGNCEKTNKDLLNYICNLLDIYCPKSYKHKNLIKYVSDRPGHDKRYSINTKKISTKLGWKKKYTFEQGIEKTVEWYLNNPNWWGAL